MIEYKSLFPFKNSRHNLKHLKRSFVNYNKLKLAPLVMNSHKTVFLTIKLFNEIMYYTGNQMILLKQTKHYHIYKLGTRETEIASELVTLKKTQSITIKQLRANVDKFN